MTRTFRSFKGFGARLLLATGVVAVLSSGSVADAQMMGGRLPCHQHKEIVKQLASRYKEAPISVGLQSNGNLLQVYASKETGTWTILSTSPQGLACIVAAGKSWEELPEIDGDPMA